MEYMWELGKRIPKIARLREIIYSNKILPMYSEVRMGEYVQ